MVTIQWFAHVAKALLSGTTCAAGSGTKESHPVFIHVFQSTRDRASWHSGEVVPQGTPERGVGGKRSLLVPACGRPWSELACSDPARAAPHSSSFSPLPPGRSRPPPGTTEGESFGASRSLAGDVREFVLLTRLKTSGSSAWGLLGKKTARPVTRASDVMPVSQCSRHQAPVVVTAGVSVPNSAAGGG